MEERTTGLILRTRPLSETSLIVNWLTADLGRISTVAKGARRAKSAFRGKLDLFHVAEFSFARSRRSELHNLREVRLVCSHAGLRRDIEKLQQVAYAAAFLERTTETETPLEDISALMFAFAEHVDGAPWRAASVLWFELRMLSLLGVEPEAAKIGVSPRTRKLIAELHASPSQEPADFCPDAGETKELTRFLHGYIVYHLDQLPRGRAAALREA